MLAAEDLQMDFGLSPVQESRRESWVSIASGRRNSRVLQNDLLLHEAVIKNEADAVEKILKDPVDVNSRNNYGRAPIHWASSRGSTEIMELLIKANCDIEAQDKYGMRPVLMAAWHGHREAVRLLVDSGACVTAVNKKQHTILICAAKSNRLEVIDYLNEAVGDLKVNAVDVDNQTALHHAAAGGHPATVKKLIDMGAEINCVNTDLKTPLHLAAEKGHQGVVLLLLQNNADINALDKNGNTPLHLSVENKQTGVVQVFLECGNNPDIENDKGHTALHTASFLGCQKIIECLLAHGSNVNYQTKTGNTPLHFACRNNEVGVAEILLSHGADINIINLKLETPMHIAAEKGFRDVCNVLLAAGADSPKTEQKEMTPLYIAARGSFSAIVDLIMKTTRLTNGQSMEDAPTFEIPRTNLKKMGKSWRQPGGKKAFREEEISREESLQNVFHTLCYKHLDEGDWKNLALHWAFSQDQIRTLERQCTGPSSYKEHGFRLLLLWSHGLGPNVDPVKELHDSLLAVGNKKVAETLKEKIIKESEIRVELKKTESWSCLIW